MGVSTPKSSGVQRLLAALRPLPAYAGGQKIRGPIRFYFGRSDLSYFRDYFIRTASAVNNNLKLFLANTALVTHATYLIGADSQQFISTIFRRPSSPPSASQRTNAWAGYSDPEAAQAFFSQLSLLFFPLDTCRITKNRPQTLPESRNDARVF
jgi:hypothetical protein